MAEEIRTGRLVLRRLAESDRGLLLKIWNDPDFIRFVCDRGIRTENQALEAMREGVLLLWAEHGFGPYRVALADSGEAIGICGLFKRPQLDEPDIGYALLPQYCGNGYALEAAAAVRDFARDGMKLKRIAAIVSPEHEKSIHLLEKLGMSPEGPIRMAGEEQDTLLYSMALD
ncbi:MAG: GNAT family N-acetyltransferase [Xanthomonadales bacterium]|jgi:RimJ/RimL family protein N-acetyltransferase|nr:GNAT family N-acetyltransferase [Xanthomonadales bacterium]